MEKIELIYFDAGGGHRAATMALAEVLGREGHWKIELTNLQTLLNPIDPIRRLTGKTIEDFYNLLLRRGWTRGTEQMLTPLHALIRYYHAEIVRLWEAHWRETQPALAVSLVPQFNRALFESVGRFDARVPMVTILTDFADFPPHFWIEPQDQYVVCGTERAAAQALEIGIKPERVLRASGMIVHPRFYETPAIDRAVEREKLGLDRNLPTGIVLFGGQGSVAIREIAERLDHLASRLQLILICGKNEKLLASLRDRPLKIKRAMLGFTKEIPYFMQLADFFIGKPGPGSLSEALLMKLPVIVERNAATMPQERYNVDWVLEKQVGLSVKNFKQIDNVVQQLLEPGVFEAYRARTAALKNRAIFEIPAMLRTIREQNIAAARQ